MVKVRTNYMQERKIHVYKFTCFEYMKILDVPLKVKKTKTIPLKLDKKYIFSVRREFI